MNTLIIYNSTHHGNTEKIANIMANTLKAKLLNCCEVNAEVLAGYDLIGIGSGIYFGKHHKSILELIDTLPAMNINAFIYSTRGGTPTWLNHRKLRKKLLEKGFKIIGEFSCRGYDTVGPLKYIGGINKRRPNKVDFKKAENFAMGLLEQK
jgi:flavodoxin